ncbi:transglycosylase SLT domain-containing protein [Amycolatopsis pigmentata]|uniref:Transglycosylase SLT domain-containing protein n=1 Tax=Amycolatopsis pigmentata TaxID=450801 RepID=A0ABW5FTA2_9PSEU
MVAAPGMPPEWAEVTSKAQQVEKLNPGAIQDVADQFDRASKDSADHAAALRSATAILGGGTWSGPAADAFFNYVKTIGDAGQKVNEHLDQVSRELTDLQAGLSDIKGKIQTIQDDAKKQIDSANSQAVTRANAAEGQERAVHAGMEGAVMPSPTSSEIMATNAKNTSAIASGARDQIQGLLNSANDHINRVMGLVKQDVEGGYSTVKPLGTAPAVASSTGGATSGGHHSYYSGGGGGGGGDGSLDVGGSGGPPATQPPGNVQQWIEEAIKELQAAGVPVTDADVKNIWAIIQHESGGNPNSINLWDSNAKAGHPSKGLMQCIDSTFNSYKLPGHNDIYNPVDNIIAGVRYTMSRYGSIANTPGIQAMAHGGGYVGY